MRARWTRRGSIGVVLALLILALAPGRAEAAPIVGVLNITGSVTVNANTINWNPPPPGVETGFGTFVTVVPGTGYFSGIPSPAPPFYTGFSRDITRDPGSAGAPPLPAFAPVGVPILVPAFLSGFTAPGYGGLFFDLTMILLSPAPVCTGAEGVGDSCRPDAGSPFTLTRLTEGTAIALEVHGFFQDLLIADSRNFATGRYTTQVGMSISEILATIAAGGSISASYSANFEARQPVPEPATLTLLGGGLLATGLVARRRRRSSR